MRIRLVVFQTLHSGRTRYVVEEVTKAEVGFSDLHVKLVQITEPSWWGKFLGRQVAVRWVFATGSGTVWHNAETSCRYPTFMESFLSSVWNAWKRGARTHCSHGFPMDRASDECPDCRH